MPVCNAQGLTRLRPSGSLLRNLLIHMDCNSVNFSEEDWLSTTNLLSNSEYREHLKYFRNVDCVVTNHNEILESSSKPQNHKLITVAVCGLVLSRLIGFSLQHNNIPLIFLVFTVF